MRTKEILAENYVKVATNESNGKVVNVYRAVCMKELPEYLVKEYASPEQLCAGLPFRGMRYVTANPDYGEFDAQVIMVRHGYIVDLYVCAILVRPFSMEAFNEYGSIVGMEPCRRAALMWDSRVFDAEHGLAATASQHSEQAVKTKKKRVRATLWQVRELERKNAELEQKNAELRDSVDAMTNKLTELNEKCRLQLMADEHLSERLKDVSGQLDKLKEEKRRLEGRGFWERVFNRDF